MATAPAPVASTAVAANSAFGGPTAAQAAAANAPRPRCTDTPFGKAIGRLLFLAFCAVQFHQAWHSFAVNIMGEEA